MADFGDYLHCILDEIALEGLDGITLSALWLRLSLRPNFTIPIDERSKVFIWKSIALYPELEFHVLAEPRGELIIFNRYNYLDTDLGIVIEPQEFPEDIYPIHVIDDNGTKGSCSTYHTRQNVTALVRNDNLILLSLEQAVSHWGQAIVIVSSQNMRWNSLLGNQVNPQIELSGIQYAMLERIGRSRYMGEVTLGKLGLSCLNESPKTLHYFRKLLMKEKLITKQMHFQKHSSGQTGSGSLFHLTRFYVERQSKMEVMLQRLCDILSTKRNNREIFSKLRNEVGMKETSFKKIFQKPFQNCLRSKSISYREFYPEADDKEALTVNGKERSVRVVELVQPFGEQDEEGDEEEKETSDTGIWVTEPRAFVKDYPLISTAYNVVESEGQEGITAQMLGRKLSLPKLETRQLCRNLDRRGVVVSFMHDVGRQRVTKFVSKYYVKDSEAHKKFLEEKRRILEFSANLQAEQSSAIDDSFSNDVVDETMAHQLTLDTEIPEKPAALIKVPKAPRSSLTAELNSSPWNKGKKKDAPHITYRVLKRANMIIEAVKSARLIDDLYKLQKMILKAEAEEGYVGKVDKKSMQRLVKKLTQDGFIKSIKTLLKLGNQEKKLHFICDPSVSSDDPLVKSTIEQAKLKSFGFTKEHVKNINKQDNLDESTDADTQNFEKISKLNSNQLNIEYTNPISSFQEAKFGKTRILYQFLFYLVYDYQGDENEENQLEDHQPQVYNYQSKDWRLFVPPLPQHLGVKSGWMLVSDILLSMPLSIFLKLVQVFYKVQGLEEFVQDDIRKYYLIRQLPQKLRNVILYGRNYIYAIYSVLTKLSYLGMLSFGPQQYKEKDQIFVYLHRNLSIKDTTISRPGYNVVSSDIDYPTKSYTLKTLKDVEEYWSDLETICLTTHLGSISSVQKIVLEVLDKKPAMIAAAANKSYDEVCDNGEIPGDKLGAGGLDSALYSHLRRNWIASSVLTGKSCPSRFRNKNKSEQDHKDQNSTVNNGGLKRKRLKLADLASLSKEKSFVSSFREGGKKRKISKNEDIPRKRRKKSNFQVQKVLVQKPDKPKNNLNIEKFVSQKLSKSEVSWSTREDSFLFLCKVVSLYLSPNYKGLIVPFSIVKLLLNKHLPGLAYNKTARGCEARLNQLVHKSNFLVLLYIFLEEMKRQSFLKQIFKEKYIKNQKHKKDVSQIFCDLFEEALHIFVPESPCKATIPLDLALHDNGNTIIDFNTFCSNSSKNIFKPKKETAIYKSIIKTIICSAILNKNNTIEAVLFHKLFNTYNHKYPKLVQQILKNLSSKKVIKTINISNSILSFLPYRFAFSFENLLKGTSDPSTFATTLEENLSQIQTLSTGLNASKWTNVNSTNISLISSLFLKDAISFEIKTEPSDAPHTLFLKLNAPFEDFFDIKLIQKHVPKFLKNHSYVFPCNSSIIPSWDCLNFIFTENEIRVIKIMFDYIVSKKSLGTTLKDITVKFSSFYHKVERYLEALYENHFVIRIGEETFRYVAYLHSDPWVVSSIKLPNHKTNELAEEYFGLEDSVKDEFIQHLSSSFPKLNYIIRIWRNPDGTLNHTLVRKSLYNIFNFIMHTPGVSKETLFKYFSNLYQSIELLELLELLENLKCISTVVLEKNEEDSFFAPSYLKALKEDCFTDDVDKNVQDTQTFYEITHDAMLKVNYIMKYFQT